MCYLKTLKFYLSILFKNLRILIQYFTEKHQHFISMFYLKTSELYFNVLFKNINFFQCFT